MIRVSHHLHSVEILICARLEDLFNSSRSPSVNRRVNFNKKLFAISATVKGTLKKIVSTVGHVDIVLTQETVHKQTRNKKEIIQKVILSCRVY